MIRIFLDVNAHHISHDTKKFLDDWAAEDIFTSTKPICAKHIFGWFFYSARTSDEESWPVESWPDDLKNLAKYALAQGCNYVNLDRDSEIVEGLPLFP